MRYLVNGFGAYHGGIVRVHNEICRELSGRGTVHVASAPRDQVDLEGIRVLSVQSSSRARSFLRDAWSSLRGGRYDVRIDSAPAFRFFTRASRRIVVVHDLNFLQPGVHRISKSQRLYRHLLHRWTLWQATAIVVNSSATGHEVNRFMPSVKDKTYVCPLPVRLPWPVTPPIQRRRASSTVRLLSFGHAANKGVDRLLGLLAVQPDYELTVIAPAAAWEAHWRGLSVSLGVSGRVRLVEAPDDEQLVDEYCRADVFCMLSTYEGYGLPVVEALSLGRPVVISDIAVLHATSLGLAEAPADDTTGALGAAIERALGHPKRHWQHAAAAIRGRDWTQWVDEMLRVAQ